MNKNKITALEQMRIASKIIIYGYENSVLDHNIKKEDIPKHNVLIEEIYNLIMVSSFKDGGECYNHPCKEIKFCTKKWLTDSINKIVTAMGY